MGVDLYGTYCGGNVLVIVQFQGSDSSWWITRAKYAKNSIEV